jgi:hypothetical protein
MATRITRPDRHHDSHSHPDHPDRLERPAENHPFTPVPPAGNWPAVASLLETARGSLRQSAQASTPAERYATAHLAALRAAAAVLAARARPDSSVRSGRGRPRSAWILLSDVAPELSEWAAFFAAGARKRAAAEAGVTRLVSAREADDLLRDAETFLSLVARAVERTVSDSHGSYVRAG